MKAGGGEWMKNVEDFFAPKPGTGVTDCFQGFFCQTDHVTPKKEWSDYPREAVDTRPSAIQAPKERKQVDRMEVIFLSRKAGGQDRPGVFRASAGARQIARPPDKRSDPDMLQQHCAEPVAAC